MGLGLKMGPGREVGPDLDMGRRPGLNMGRWRLGRPGGGRRLV